MGSKTPANKEKRDNTCDVCNIKFQTVQALRSHKNAKHPAESQKRESSPAHRPKATPKNTPAAPTSRVSKRLQLKKGGDVETEESENSEDQNMGDRTNKIEFVCPKCAKAFRMYFQALKHIQIKHCVDDEGNPVSPESPDIIKPTRVETCPRCNERVASTHKCTSNVPVNTFCCLGCDEEFMSIALFNKHVTHMHYENVESMFFKTSEEFNLWKQRMETQVRIKYLALNKAVIQKFFQCNYVSSKNEFNKTYLCSSVIIKKELSTGIQIHYIKQHSGHTCPDYELPQEFSHCLSSKKKDESAFDNLIEKNDDEDLYVKFKNLMNNIINDAEKLSISHLNKLLRSALKMQALLNNFDEDHDDKEMIQMSSNMTDDQITDALEGKRTSARLKRKSETRVSVDAKKTKVEKSDDNVNSKSKNDENGNKTTYKENKIFELKPRSSPALLSPSFNDTYRQFISTTESNEDSIKKSKNSKRKEIVKTKMGQFSPKKKAINAEETVEKTKSTPNVLKPLKTNTRFNYIDLKYEVREQENDCNILVLKI